MKIVDDNVKYLCETFPDMVRRLVLKAKEIEILAAHDTGALRDLGEAMKTLRGDLQEWASGQDWVLKKIRERSGR